MRDLGSRLSQRKSAGETVKIECPNCGQTKMQVSSKKKASCARCGNVWEWARRGRGLVSLKRRAG